MSDPTPQLLLTGRPICSRCIHGHMIEIITGREKTPLEYHCGYCGNYAIVGVNTRWPFMVAVKAEPPNIEIPGNDNCDHHEAGSSPMQVGEALVKASANYAKNIPKRTQETVKTDEKPAKKCKPEKEAKSMPKPRCEREGCKEPSEALFLCGLHFQERYGITVEEYRTNKLHRTETVNSVVRRLKGEPIDSYPESEQKPPVIEQKPPERETKGPVSEPKPDAADVEKQEPIPLFQIFLDPELLDKLTKAAKREYRTPELHAAYLIDQSLNREYGGSQK